MARIEFWGGDGVIGSSKVLIRDGGTGSCWTWAWTSRATATCSAARPPGRTAASCPPGCGSGPRPPSPGLYDPDGLDPADPLGEPAEPTAVFVSHPHIDHVGLAGFLRADIPAYAAPEAIALLCALDHGGETLPGPRDFSAAATSWRPAGAGHAVQVGPIAVERLDVDHDVPGASGYRVTTGDGVLAFTGDLRFHGHHPERSWAFAGAVAGCDVLVTEGTTLSFDERSPARTEADVTRDYAAALDGVPDLMLQSCTRGTWTGSGPSPPSRPRPAGRSCGPAASRPSSRPPGRAGHHPGPGRPGRRAGGPRPLDAADLPACWSCRSARPAPCCTPTASRSARSVPAGPCTPTGWARCGLPLRLIGCSGHAAQDDLHEMMYRIRPAVVIPVPTRSPYRLHPVGGTARLVVDYARACDFAGQPLPDRA